MLEVGHKIKVHIMDHVHRSEIHTENDGKVFQIVPDLYGSPGIWWNGESGGLYLLVAFAWSVVFEDAETGKLFHNRYGEIVPLDVQRYSDIVPARG